MTFTLAFLQFNRSLSNTHHTVYLQGQGWGLRYPGPGNHTDPQYQRGLLQCHRFPTLPVCCRDVETVSYTLVISLMMLYIIVLLSLSHFKS